ncbi:MAG: hypothetical protein RIQ56_98, partial [Candidatus Parcubacteria bacterium]
PLYFETFTPVSQNWRWYDDETNETPTSALESENTAPTNIADANSIKLRFTIFETASIGASGAKFKLQYSTSSDFSSGGIDVVEIGNCTGGSQWCYANGIDADNDVISTKLLSDADSCSGSVGNGCGIHNESGTSTTSFEHVAGAATEYEFTIKASGAYGATAYFFRPVFTPTNTIVPLNTGETYPSLSTAGGTLTFLIDGIASTTATEGITTDIDTTATEVSFGSLPLAADIIAAQRLTVTTNAGQGYQVFAVARQGLLNEYGDELPPVSGTNASPSGWSTGCATLANGCFGYHAGDDTLLGGSARFAPDDTYARFSTTTANEIAYNSGPATNQTTDVVYRILARGEQESGNYSSALVYIVVPTF